MRELEQALQRVVSTGHPEAVTLVGSAGIGKTRLVHEFLSEVQEQHPQARPFRGTCREGGPAFGVIQRILRARFGIPDGADPEQTAETFRRMVSDALHDRRVTEFLHFLGAFLDLRFPDSPFIKAVEDDPQQFGIVSRAVLRRFFEVDAEKQPLVLTFEDLHWAQDDSLDVVHYLINSLRDAPVLVLAVARPELLARRSDWMEGPGSHTKIELSPLEAEDSASLMANLLEPVGDPPDELIDAAVDLAGGSPYLLEHMVRTFFDNGTLVARDDGSWEVHLERLDDAELPLTVDDAISARISSLTPAERELLEKASTMGSVFWMEALIALSRIGKPTPDLWGGHESLVSHYQELLDSLAERDYILPMPDSSIPGAVEYAFKHNLERETLHKLASRTQMRRFHLVVAEWLEFRLPDYGEEQCEMLAQHYEEGGAAHKAAEYYLRAGDRARARYANSKAAEYYSRGLELLGDEDVTRRIDALHHHGDVLQLAGRNEEALQAFRRMLDIAFRLDLKSKGGAAHNRIGRLYRAIGQLDQAMRHLGTGQALFYAAGDQRGVASSLDDIGKVHWMRGTYESAERFMRQALELRQQIGDQRSLALSYNNLGLVYQDSGRFSEALEAFEEALVRRQEIGDRPGISQTLNNLGTIHQDNGDHDRAVDLYEEALDVARGVGDRMRQAVVLTNLGESHYRRQAPAEAIKVLKQAEHISETLGDWILEGEILRGLAKAHMMVQDYPTARGYITESIAKFERARGKPFLGVALRTEGEIAAAAGWTGEDHEKAKQSFEKAIELFDELGNEIELARSCEAYADFLDSSGETRQNERAEQAAELRSRAQAIRERQRESEGAALPPLEGEPTNPAAWNPLQQG
jgi:tetratricopeptide (TPR) repeat protein